MNLDEIENLSYEQIMLLYDNIIDNSCDDNISAIPLSWYCTGYCTCYNGKTRAGSGFSDYNHTGRTYAGNNGTLCVSTNQYNIYAACGTDNYTSRQYLQLCTPYRA